MIIVTVINNCHHQFLLSLALSFKAARCHQLVRATNLCECDLNFLSLVITIIAMIGAIRVLSYISGSAVKNNCL